MSNPKFTAALEGEITRIFGLAGLGVDFGGDNPDYTLVLPNAVPAGTNLEPQAGGFTLPGRGGRIESRGWVYQSRFEQFDPATTQNSTYLGIAMGRAGAHEIGHFLLQIGSNHPASGLMAAAPAGPGGSIWHLPDSTGRFAFTGDQVLRLQMDCGHRSVTAGALGGIGPDQYSIYFPTTYLGEGEVSFGLPIILWENTDGSNGRFPRQNPN